MPATMMPVWEIEYDADGQPARMYWHGMQPVPPKPCDLGGPHHEPEAIIAIGRYRRCRICRRAWEA